MPTTIPYSVRIPKELLDEMKRYYDRMDPPKPTFSAILSHIVKMGWESYMTRTAKGARPPGLLFLHFLRGSKSGPSK
ncbi:hypothetical protein E6H19_05430 [Candidatus Bathyarchaeota archaeon]|nr:MAG: hypothetical protein E6H30_05760 [Candidatus Bathyarchaeota archaeon]TMI45230.1 MAG: hypothetical protein E6H19_05430 [Candidatus Bathyarchaeota archaeon]